MFGGLTRFLLFGAMNIAVIAAVSIILKVTGLDAYLYANGSGYTQLFVMCLLWGAVGSFISLQLSRWQAKKFMGVQLFDESDARFGKLVRTVHRLSEAAQLPKMPEVGVYESPEVNAFATGPSKSRSLVAVSTGLLSNMNEEELEGVLAHEVSHIANGDMVTMTLIQGVINAFVMFFARIAAMAVENALRGDDDEGSSMGGMSYFVTTMIFQVIFGFIGSFIVAFFSRYREYRADSGAARLTGSGKMIAALKRLQLQYESGPVDKGSEKIAALKISSHNKVLALLSTHPPLQDRIDALQRV